MAMLYWVYYMPCRNNHQVVVGLRKMRAFAYVLCCQFIVKAKVLSPQTPHPPAEKKKCMAQQHSSDALSYCSSLGKCHTCYIANNAYVNTCFYHVCSLVSQPCSQLSRPPARKCVSVTHKIQTSCTHTQLNDTHEFRGHRWQTSKVVSVVRNLLIISGGVW